MRTSKRIDLPDESREELLRLVRSRNTPQKVVLRARIILLSAEGMGTVTMAERLGTSFPTIMRWRERYERMGVPGLLKDAPRPGRRRRFTDEFIASVVQRTVQEKPANASHWSCGQIHSSVPSGSSPSMSGTNVPCPEY
jgi:Winged helix-turn helix